MLVMFKATNKTKYSVEAFHLLSQYYLVFSERLKKQLLWSRTVNIHGKPGKNIPMDLHMEHLNRLFKNAICKLGPNTIDSSLDRTGCALKLLTEIQLNYDCTSEVTVESSFHTFHATTKDLNLIIDQLKKSNVFNEIRDRKHKQFRNFKGSVMDHMKQKDLKEWMTRKFRDIIRYDV